MSETTNNINSLNANDVLSRMIQKRIIYLRQMFNNTLNASAMMALTLTVSVVVDLILIGQFFGVSSLAAYGFIVPIILLKTAIFSMITAGEHTICSKCIAHIDIKGANGCFNASLIIMLAVSILLGGAIALFAQPLASVLDAGNQDAEVVEAAKFFIWGIAIGFPFEAYNLSVSQLLLVDNDRERTNLSAVVFVIISVIGDFVNVFVLHWGMFGIGFTTSVAFMVQALNLSFHFRRPEANCELNPKLSIFKNWSEVLKIGFGVTIHASFTILKTILMNYQLMFLIGIGGVAAFAIQTNVQSVFCILTVALAPTLIALGEVFIWEKNSLGLKEMGYRSIRISLVVSILVTIILFFVAPWVSQLYLKDAIENEIATTAIRYFSMGIIFYSFNIAVQSYWLGTKKFKPAIIMGLCSDFIYIIALIFILPIFMGANGLWAVFPTSQILTTITIFIIAIVVNKKVSFRISDILMIDKTPEDQSSREYDLIFSDMKSVKTASEEAGNLCRKNGIDEIRSNSISLCVEELCNNLVIHGITNPEIQHIAVRVVVERGDVILRIRDTCPNFNPYDHSKYFKKNDPASGIGMRMVHNMQKSVFYWSSLRMNNITIVI